MNAANKGTMGMLPLSGENAQPDNCEQLALAHADSYSGEGVPDGLKDFYKRDDKHKTPPSVSELEALNETLSLSATNDIEGMSEEQRAQFVDLTPEEEEAVRLARDAEKAE